MINQAKSILTKLNLPLNHHVYVQIREMLQGKDGYVGLFTKLYFLKNVQMTSLKNLLEVIQTQPNLIQQLPKPLIQYDDYEKIQDDLEKSRITIHAKQMYDEFPSSQKQLIKLEEDKNLLYLLSKHKSKANFLRKISSYKQRKTLLSNLKLFLDSVSTDRFDNLMQVLKEMHHSIRIVYKSLKKNIVIVRVQDHSSLVKIASDTSWCIVRESSMFRNYVRNSDVKQFVIFLLDKKESDNLRKIGATFSIYATNKDKKTFVTAHDIRDGYVDYNQLKTILSEYKFDIEKLHVNKDDIEDLDAHTVTQLINCAGFTTDEILARKRSFKSEDLNLFTAEQINKYDLLNKTEIHGDTLFKKYSHQEIMDRKLFKRVVYGTLPLNDILQFDIDYLKKNYNDLANILKSNKTDRGISDADFLNKHLKARPKYVSDFRVGSRWSSSDSFSIEKTIFKLKWYKIKAKNFTFEHLVDVFEDSSIYSDNLIVDYLIEAGWKFTKQQILDFYKKVFRKGTFETYIALITNKKLHLCVDDSDFKPELLKYVSEYHQYSGESAGLLKDYDAKKVREIFTPKELEKFEEIQKSMNFSKELEDLVYRRYSNSHYDIKKLEVFYEKWNTFVQQRFTMQYRPNFYNFKQEQQVYLAVLYCKLDKLDELNHIPFEWRIGRGSFNDDAGNFIADVITDQYCTNGGLNVKLEQSERRKLYYWFSKYELQYAEDYFKITKSEVKDHELSVMYFLYSYDEDFQDFLLRVKNVKRKSSVARMEYLKKLFNYLITKNESKLTNWKNEENWVFSIDESMMKKLNALLNEIKTWDQGMIEFKKNLEHLSWISCNNPNQSILRKYVKKTFKKFTFFTVAVYEPDSRWVGDHLSDEMYKRLAAVV